MIYTDCDPGVSERILDRPGKPPLKFYGRIIGKVTAYESRDLELDAPPENLIRRFRARCVFQTESEPCKYVYHYYYTGPLILGVDTDTFVFDSWDSLTKFLDEQLGWYNEEDVALREQLGLKLYEEI